MNAVAPLTTAETAPSASPALHFIDRTMFQCAWINGHGEDGLATCCGAAVIRPGVSWCRGHARRVIRPEAWAQFARHTRPPGR